MHAKLLNYYDYEAYQPLGPGLGVSADIPSVVVVDDNVPSLALYRLGARALAVDLHTFRSPEDSLRYLSEHRADLVFLDVLMRGTDGLTLLKRVRALEHHRDTPVVMVTSKDYHQDRQIARDLGAAEYLLKPLRAREIRAVIERHTGAAPRDGEGGPR